MKPAVTVAYIGIGSNLGDPFSQIARAVDSLRHIPATTLKSCSSLYRNPPMGPPDQPDYVNAVARVDTQLGARALLVHMQSIERAQGRTRDGMRWGPRLIDLDLLVYGDARIAEDQLQVPHPGIAERPFVLVPLHEIAPDLVIPGHASLSTLLAAVDATGMVRAAQPPC